MLAPFLIMLREGLEAALIVGIVASYLARTARREWLPALWLGVGLACAASLAAGAVLDILAGELPQRAQELFEAVIGGVAAAMLGSMALWMRKAAKTIKGALQAGVDAALAGPRQGFALVGLAFLAVAREGLESVFFLLAILQQASGPAPFAGAALGLMLAAGIGYAIYVLGAKLDLRAFFRWTGIVILFVAAGLVADAVRSLHEAGIWNHLQQPVYDLGAVLPADGAAGALLSGLFGYRESAVLGELLAYLAYLLPMLALFLRGDRQGTARPVAAQPSARRHALPLRRAGWATLLLACAGAGAFVFAATRRGPPAAGAGDIAIAITERSCDPATLTIPAGPASFVVSNRGERALEWEILDGVMVLEERENIAPGQSRRLTTQLRPGVYAITCGLARTPHGRLIVQSSGETPPARLTLADLVGPAAEYRARLSDRSSALVGAVEAVAEATDDAAKAAALSQAESLLRLLRPSAGGDASLAEQFAALHALLTQQSGSEQRLAAARALEDALDRRMVLPDAMLAGAGAALARPGQTGSDDDLSAAAEIARLLLPLTERVAPELAARVRSDLDALAQAKQPADGSARFASDLAAMRKALAIAEAEPKS